MIKVYSTAAMLFVSACMLASGHNSPEVRYITNNKRLPDVAYQQQLRENSSWKNFISTNGTWYAVFNEENAKPHRAFGKPVAVFGMTPEARALNFINSKLHDFNLPVSELVAKGTAVSEHFSYVHFKQVHSGVEVLNSDLYVKMTPAGEVISFGCDVFSDISITMSPSVSPAAALAAAKTGISGITGATVNSQLFILPVPEFKQNIYHLVYEATVSSADAAGMPARYKALVDANTGVLLSRKDEIVHAETPVSPAPAAATDVTITGTVFTTNPFDPSTVRPLRNLKVLESGITYNTDSAGFVGLAASAPTTVNFSLEGLWSHVYTGTVTPSFSATANPGTNTYSFDSDANIRELSAYYHVNIVHDYMKTKYPSFTGLDNSLPTNVDLTSGTCNAFYDGSSINFYALGGGCNSMAQIGDVIYHEYGHGINDKFYQSQGASFNNGAMGEGYADIWALGITNNPILGTGMDVADPGVFVRRYDINKKVYPQDLNGEVHADGEIIAGAWWDTNLNFGDLQQMMDLYKETFYATVTGPDGTEGQVYVDILIEALTSDDVPANGGDNDITNGTPNDLDIVNAFALHGITLLSNAVVTHTAVTASAAGAGIPIAANISVTYPWAMSNAKVYYKINRTGSWNNLNMTVVTGSSYTATIPAQPAGTVIGYYIGLEDNGGILSAVQPIAANLVNPNIPYFIVTGATLVGEEDFDDNFGAWGPGIPSDNATTGLWTIAAPVGSFATPGDASTIVQPNTQTTPGGVYCAVTGNAASASAALGANDVDGGVTTLESPVYNLSTFVNPIFTYRRWYINNPPSGANPGNDSWEVQVSNDGSTWTKVERTNVSDKSWRRFAFRVKDYVPLTSTVQFRFMVADSIIPGAYLDGGSLVEGALDDMYLYEEVTSSINENSNVSAVTIYPNPSMTTATLNYLLSEESDVTVSVTDYLGRVVFTLQPGKAVGAQSISLPVEQFAAGVYQVTVASGKNRHVQKLTVLK